jgi:hypothetical protein
MALPISSERVEAFERKGFGMFIHLRLYSQLGQGDWAQFITKIPMPEYGDWNSSKIWQKSSLRLKQPAIRMGWILS